MLLQSSASDVQNTLRALAPIAQVSLGEEQQAPRPYAAAKSYLSITQLNFEENSFVRFMRAVQEVGHFEVGELWSLSPMLQLSLLLQISECVRESNDENGTASVVQLGKLFTALDRVRRASWKKVFLQVSWTETILRGDPVDYYRRMDFQSCDHYREAVQQLSLFSDKSEEEVAQRAVNMALAGMSRFPAGTRQSQRYGHVGYYLVDKGRAYLEKEIRYQPQGLAFIRAVLLEAPALFYFLGVEFCIFAILLFILSGIPVGFPFFAATLLFLLPVSEAAVEVINPFILFLLPPRVLPRLDFSEGIPQESLTVVAVPTLLISKVQVQDLVRTLEIRYLGNVDPNLYFGLLTDPPDSSQPFDEKDELVTMCSGLIAELNRKYCKGGNGCFFHLHRHRTFNETEQTWMGWERKRGKLLDFNELLRGGEDRFP
jgi:cyclic beta-1,2-glucan synthetase